ncbi:LmeA family phospholipid-binding protein [Tsukamurella soli]|uniref:LmeA family phospholipid-binding protein n=1 Tax=Tsukamurella soli TaxID=644556 RepID=UPI00361D30FA
MTAARDGRYRRVSIAVPNVGVGDGRVAQLEAELHDVHLPAGTHLVSADTPLHVAVIDARVRLAQKDFGRLLGIVDVQVHTPVPGNVAGAGGPADGLVKSATGVILTGEIPLPTPTDPRRTVTVSVSCDFSAVNNAVSVRATRIYTGPEDHATAHLLPGDIPRVLAAFTKTLPPMRLPFGLTATGAEGENADVVLLGSARDTTVTPAAFYRVGP